MVVFAVVVVVFVVSVITFSPAPQQPVEDVIIAGPCAASDDRPLGHLPCHGDKAFCDVANSTSRPYDQCGFACGYEKTWFGPCLWLTVANMDSYCLDVGHHRHINWPENLTYDVLNQSAAVGATFDGCFLRSFCGACLESGTQIRPTCSAFLHFYGTTSGDDDHPCLQFFDHLHFWCDGNIQRLIRQGLFPKDLTAATLDALTT